MDWMGLAAQPRALLTPPQNWNLRDTNPALPSCHQPSLQQLPRKQSVKAIAGPLVPHVPGTPWVVSKDLMEKRRVEKTVKKRDTHVRLFNGWGLLINPSEFPFFELLQQSPAVINETLANFCNTVTMKQNLSHGVVSHTHVMD